VPPKIPAPLQKLRPKLIPPEAVILKAKQSDLDLVARLAAKLEPSFAAAVMSYLDGITQEVSLAALIRALKAGNISEVIGILAALDTGAAQAKLATSVQNAVWGGGAIAATQINAQLKGVTFAFDKLNPRLVSFLQTYTLRLIREIHDTTKEAVRGSLIAGMTAGDAPAAATARAIKEGIGLTKRQQAAVNAYRKELETFHERSSAKGWKLGGKTDQANGHQAFREGPDGKPLDGVMERRLRDFRYDKTMIKAMESGKPIPPEKIDKMVAAYRRKYLRFRSMTIARTESLRATNYGVQDAWRQAIEGQKVCEGLVRRKWKVGADERLCSVCAPIPGLNPAKGVKFGESFATPNGPTFLPPIHPNCRCTVFIRTYAASQLETKK
jgi:hypothetical protein